MIKKENFIGQRMIVLPSKIINYLKNNELTKDSYITDIGYFPFAKDHFRRREEGSMQNIIIYCSEGTGWVSVEGKRYSVKKDEYCIIPKNTPHTYAASKEDPWTIYWLHFGGFKAEQLFYHHGYHFVTGPADHKFYNERIHLFDKIYFNLETEYSNNNLEYAGIILMHLLGSFKFENNNKLESQLLKNDITMKAIAFMKLNIGRKIELKEISQHCNISVSHFCLLFKKNTLHTPVEYLNHLRIQRACQLLDLTTLKINKISNDVGFSDPFYFSKVFRKVMGLSPVNYRRERSG